MDSPALGLRSAPDVRDAGGALRLSLASAERPALLRCYAWDALASRARPREAPDTINLAIVHYSLGLCGPIVLQVRRPRAWQGEAARRIWSESGPPRAMLSADEPRSRRPSPERCRATSLFNPSLMKYLSCPLAEAPPPTFVSASTTLGAPVESRPRQQSHPPALDASRHAETVEFDLMEPLRP
jgi:hypothetical protein